MSVNVWAEIRRAYAKNVPSKLTATYLQSLLKTSEKNAKNILPQLRNVGLVDKDGAPLDSAKRYRLDSEYAAVVAKLAEDVYPAELRELYPGPREDVQAVANWFMLRTGGGQLGASAQAKFYLMLVSGELPTAEAPVSRMASATDPSKAPRKASATTPGSPKPAQPKNNGNLVERVPSSQQSPTLPGLHLDIQIHIDADASVDQIDAVFASMAKHIYRRD